MFSFRCGTLRRRWTRGRRRARCACAPSSSTRDASSGCSSTSFKSCRGEEVCSSSDHHRRGLLHSHPWFPFISLQCYPLGSIISFGKPKSSLSDGFQFHSSSHDDTILIWDFLNCTTGQGRPQHQVSLSLEQQNLISLAFSETLTRVSGFD